MERVVGESSERIRKIKAREREREREREVNNKGRKANLHTYIYMHKPVVYCVYTVAGTGMNKHWQGTLLRIHLCP